jgi:hypothetical protein
MKPTQTHFIPLLLLLFIAPYSQAQPNRIRYEPFKQTFSYDDNVDFIITEMLEYKKMFSGSTPRRGYTRYFFRFLFTNKSKEERFVAPQLIFLANPATKKKYTIDVSKPRKDLIKIRPGKQKELMFYVVYEENEPIYLLIHEKLQEVLFR